MQDSSPILEQIIKDAMAFLLLSLQLDDGEMGYAYIALPADKVAPFFQQFGGRTLAWPDYVTVLYQGLGERPPEPVREWFHDTYGIDS